MADTEDEYRLPAPDQVHSQEEESRIRNEFAYRAELAAERKLGIAMGMAMGMASFARKMLGQGFERALVASALGIAEAELDGFLAKH